MPILLHPPRSARPIIARRDQLIAERALLAQEYQARDRQYAIVIGELDRQVTQLQARRWTIRLIRWARRVCRVRSTAIPGAGSPRAAQKEQPHDHDG